MDSSEMIMFEYVFCNKADVFGRQTFIRQAVSDTSDMGEKPLLVITCVDMPSVLTNE